MRALPESWDTQTSIIRYHNDMGKMSIDEIYGMLKTHDIEMQQRKDRKSNKAKQVALTANTRSNHVKERSLRKGKGKANIIQPDESSIDADSEANIDGESYTDSSNEEMVQMVAILVKGLKKMKYRKKRIQGNFSRKSSGTDNKERFKKREGNESKPDKVDKSKIKCYNCDGIGVITGNFTNIYFVHNEIL